MREEANLHLEFTNLMECGHPGNVLLMCQGVFWRWSTVRRNSTQCSLFFGLGFDPSAMKDADHDAVSMLSSLEAQHVLRMRDMGSFLLRCC